MKFQIGIIAGFVLFYWFKIGKPGALFDITVCKVNTVLVIFYLILVQSDY